MQCHVPQAPELHIFNPFPFPLSKPKNGHTNLYSFVMIYFATEHLFFWNAYDHERQLEHWNLCFRCEAFRNSYYFLRFDLHQEITARSLDRSYAHVFHEFLALIPNPIRFL